MVVRSLAAHISVWLESACWQTCRQQAVCDPLVCQCHIVRSPTVGPPFCLCGISFLPRDFRLSAHWLLIRHQFVSHFPMIVIKYNSFPLLVYSSNNAKSSLFDVYDVSCFWIVCATFCKSQSGHESSSVLYFSLWTKQNTNKIRSSVSWPCYIHTKTFTAHQSRPSNG